MDESNFPFTETLVQRVLNFHFINFESLNFHYEHLNSFFQNKFSLVTMRRIELTVGSEACEVSVVLQRNHKHNWHFSLFDSVCLLESNSEAISSARHSLNINVSWFVFVSSFDLASRHVFEALCAHGVFPVLKPLSYH